MKIAKFCQREFVTIHAHELLRSAAALMREQHVGALVVIDSAEPPRVRASSLTVISQSKC